MIRTFAASALTVLALATPALAAGGGDAHIEIFDVVKNADLIGHEIAYCSEKNSSSRRYVRTSASPDKERRISAPAIMLRLS